MRQSGVDPPQLSKPLQSPDQGIARLGLPADIVKDVLPVIGTHRNGPIRAPFGFTTSFLGDDGGDHFHHIGSPCEVRRSGIAWNARYK